VTALALPPAAILERLRQGVVIPAHPLALTGDRRLDERRQRALTRYYLAAGAGGLAVGVHTTQFAIREAGLYRPVLELAAETIAERDPSESVIRVAGIVGPTGQALAEARIAVDLGYHSGLVSPGAHQSASVDELTAHMRAVSEIIPLFGFYLQPAVGGRALEPAFWHRLLEIENLIAIKVAPFDRYETQAVARAVLESGRADDVALYTGNDDHILLDLLTPFDFGTGSETRFVGGLLGQWAVWTKRAVEHLDACRHAVGERQSPVPGTLLNLATQLTDANAAIFDVANRFAGSIPGIHEILRRQGLLTGRWCLDSREDLSPGQLEEIDRVCKAYPHLADDTFVAEHLDDWLA
jgi:dihydrodipicolinate synthase/N-acetylneuraminate lyase